MKEVSYEMNGTHMKIIVPKDALEGTSGLQGYQKDEMVVKQAIKIYNDPCMKSSLKQVLEISKTESDQGREF